MLKKHYPKATKYLKQAIKESSKPVLLLTVMGVLMALASATVPYFVGRFFDALLAPEKAVEIASVLIPLFALILAGWGVAQLINNLLGWQVQIRGDRLGTSLSVAYLSRVATHLNRLPIAFHTRRKSGNIGKYLNDGANGIESIVAHMAPNLLPEFLSVIFGVVIALWVNWFLALVLLLGLITYLIFLPKLIGQVAGKQRAMRSAYGELYSQVYEDLGNISEIKQATAEKHESDELAKKARRAKRAWFGLHRIWENVTLTRGLVVLGVQLAIFVFSIFMIGEGQMTIGELIMFNAYAGMFYGPFMRLGYNWQNLENGLGALEKSEAIMLEKEERYHPENAIDSGEFVGSVKFEGVEFEYEAKNKGILQGINFEVKEGEVVALVGESGAGKSTIIALLSGYYLPRKGRVLIGGENLKKYDLHYLRSQIAVVPQEVVLFNESIEHNIRYGNFKAKEEQIKEAAKKSHAYDFIEKFPKRYKQIVGERGIRLSVGQKQRIAIARAIFRDPKILILDEPTSALDAKSEKFIQASLGELMKDRTTFIIAHRLSTVRRADKILVLKEGKIVEEGKHEELIRIKGGEYRHLYELQIGLRN